MAKSKVFTTETKKGLIIDIQSDKEQFEGQTSKRSLSRGLKIAQEGEEYLISSVLESSFIEDSGRVVNFVKVVAYDKEGIKQAFKNFLPIAQDNELGRLVGDSTESATNALSGKVVRIVSHTVLTHSDNGEELRFPRNVYEIELMS